MTTRFTEALQSQSACNPSGLCHALVRYQQEIMALPGGSTQKVRDDPACRLVAYQLAFLFKTSSMDQMSEYGAITAQCERLADEQTCQSA